VTLPRYKYVFFDPNLLRAGKNSTERRHILWHNLWLSYNFILLVNSIQSSESFAVRAGDLSDEDRQRLDTS
jgi:hypothetical protein